MRNRVFHTANIGGLDFKASMNDNGPYLCCVQRNKGVALGVSRIRHFHPRFTPGKEGWWVVKYEAENRIDISCFSEAQASELASEFGLDLWAPIKSSSVTSINAFYQGKAWDSLKAWVVAHPRIAKRIGMNTRQHYLPDWYSRATA